MPDDILYCCDHSLEVNDIMLGSAPRVDVWFLLEYNAVWGNKAFPESTLSDVVKNHLQTALDTIPDSRLVFIRQPERRTDAISFFMVDSRIANPKIRAYELTQYEDLLLFNIEAVLNSIVDTPLEVAAPEVLYLICTNGKRDLACSKYGIPLYHAMTAHAGASAWQATHLGGHRFAATSAFLPHGLVYGHLEMETVCDLMDDYEQGIVNPKYLRGRASYDLPVQAAEGYLFDNISPNLDDWRLIDSQALSEVETIVTIELTGENTRHTVKVRRELSDYEVLKSTGDVAPVQVPIFRIVEHTKTGK